MIMSSISEVHQTLNLIFTCDEQEASQSNLMDLEIADYEKTVSNLNVIIQEKDCKTLELQTEIERLQTRNESMQKEIGLTVFLFMNIKTNYRALYYTEDY